MEQRGADKGGRGNREVTMGRWRKFRRLKKPMGADKHYNNLISGMKRRCHLSDVELLDVKAWLSGLKGTSPIACGYCEAWVDFVNISVDHAQPISRGGLSEPTNLIACCKQCNQAKGNMTQDEYRALLNAISAFEDGGERVLKRLVAAGNMFRGWRRRG